MVGCSASILFLCSNIRHELFASNSDLGIFAQAVYLMSQGCPPIASLLGFTSSAILLSGFFILWLYWTKFIYVNNPEERLLQLWQYDSIFISEQLLRFKVYLCWFVWLHPEV